MVLISESEYESLKKKWLREQYAKADPKPSGMFANWGWNIRKSREFKQMLADKGIEVDWYVGPDI